MIDLPIEFDPSNYLFDRTDLKKDIVRYWIDWKGDRLTYGPSNFVKLGDNGKLIAYEPWQIKFARTDIGYLIAKRPGDGFLAPKLFMVTIYADGPYEGPNTGSKSEPIETTTAVLGAITTRMLQFLDANVEGVERQRRWFRERPWEKLDGLTPEEAVIKLEEMGW